MTGPAAPGDRRPDDGTTALMLAAAAGDRAAFDQLVLRLTPTLTRIAYRFAAPTYVADVVQETWLRAWEYRHTYRGNARPATWLYQIMANLTTRDRALRPTPAPTVETDLSQLAGGDDTEAGYHQLVADSIERALARLSEREAQLIRMRDLQQATWATICAQMGYRNTGAAKDTYTRTMRRLVALHRPPPALAPRPPRRHGAA